MVDYYLWHGYPDPNLRVPLIARKDAPGLDDVICKKLACDPVGILSGNPFAFQAVSFRRIDRLTGLEPDIEEIFHRLLSSAPGIVANAGTISHPQHPVKIDIKRVKCGDLRHRIAKYLLLNRPELIGMNICVNRQDMHGSHRQKIYAEIVFCLPAYSRAFGIKKIRP